MFLTLWLHYYFHAGNLLDVVRAYFGTHFVAGGYRHALNWARLDALAAQITVHCLVSIGVEEHSPKRTCLNAFFATDALSSIYDHHAIVGLKDRVSRTWLGTGRIRTMPARNDIIQNLGSKSSQPPLLGIVDLVMTDCASHFAYTASCADV